MSWPVGALPVARTGFNRANQSVASAKSGLRIQRAVKAGLVAATQVGTLMTKTIHVQFKSN